MRNTLLATVVVFTITGNCFAQAQKPSPVQNQKAPQRAAAPQPQQSPQQAPQQSSGYYAAPPRSGTFAGGSSSVGVEGMALHFPAMSLKLPTLQFPSLFSLRNPPKVMMGPTSAPFVEQQQPVGVGAPVAVQAMVGAPAAAPNRAAAPNQSPVQRNLQKSASLQHRADEVAALRAHVAELVSRLEQASNGHAQQDTFSAPARTPVQAAEHDPSKLDRLERQVLKLQSTLEQLAIMQQQGSLTQANHLTPVPAREVAARLMAPRGASISGPRPVTAKAVAPQPSMLRMPPISYR